jgi:hypothetical protein
MCSELMSDSNASNVCARLAVTGPPSESSWLLPRVKRQGQRWNPASTGKSSSLPGMLMRRRMRRCAVNFARVESVSCLPVTERIATMVFWLGPSSRFVLVCLVTCREQRHSEGTWHSYCEGVTTGSGAVEEAQENLKACLPSGLSLGWHPPGI